MNEMLPLHGTNEFYFCTDTSSFAGISLMSQFHTFLKTSYTRTGRMST